MPLTETSIVEAFGSGNTSAALNLGGCGGRSYNVGEYESASNMSWLSYGCGLAHTKGTTNNNYWVEGNILTGDFAPTHSAQQAGCCDSSACAKAPNFHVCCNGRSKACRARSASCSSGRHRGR